MTYLKSDGFMFVKPTHIMAMAGLLNNENCDDLETDDKGRYIDVQFAYTLGTVVHSRLYSLYVFQLFIMALIVPKIPIQCTIIMPLIV